MCPAVCAGISQTSASKRPDPRSGRPRPARGPAGRRGGLPRGPVTGAPVASWIAWLPPVWSGCQWVLRICVSRQPRASGRVQHRRPDRRDRPPPSRRWPRRAAARHNCRSAPGPATTVRRMSITTRPCSASTPRARPGPGARPSAAARSEILSGDCTNAMCPSRGGRLMVTPCVHQPLAGLVDIVDLVGEVAEVAAAAIARLVPIVGQLDLAALIARHAEENQREVALRSFSIRRRSSRPNS